MQLKSSAGYSRLGLSHNFPTPQEAILVTRSFAWWKSGYFLGHNRNFEHDNKYKQQSTYEHKSLTVSSSAYLALLDFHFYQQLKPGSVF